MTDRTDFEAARAKIEDLVKEHGWAVQRVLPGRDLVRDPCYAYSVGITETLGHPEIMMIGFEPDLMMRLINDAGELVRAGARFGEWDSSDRVVRGYPVVFRTVPEPGATRFARAAAARCRGGSFHLLQMFLPDPAGLFPWQDGCDESMQRLQGVLLSSMPRPN